MIRISAFKQNFMQISYIHINTNLHDESLVFQGIRDDDSLDERETYSTYVRSYTQSALHQLLLRLPQLLIITTVYSFCFAFDRFLWDMSNIKLLRKTMNTSLIEENSNSIWKTCIAIICNCIRFHEYSLLFFVDYEIRRVLWCEFSFFYGLVSVCSRILFDFSKDQG